MFYNYNIEKDINSLLYEGIYRLTTKQMNATIIMIALAAIGAVTMMTTTPALATSENEFSVDNSISINENCKEDCTYKGDIEQHGSIDYSEDNGQSLSDDVLVVDVDGLHGHEATISTEVLETGAYAEIEIEDYDNYYATFHWFEGKAPIGSTFKSCVTDHKTDNQDCKTKVHQKNPDHINLNAD